MFPRRENEPDYALLNDPETQEVNRYGKPIQTVPEDDPRAKEFVINDQPQVSENPNRLKQHGFFFNADNCIACHACEAACSEKNDNPAHIAFRSVGFVEGGTYPAYQRLNISMACNHCDDPVCLKGCPTRAYTKFAEYGAVLQDPDICFGCGYCTWVCPYNAPQLDPVKGQVSKCNMCVDRLEVGLKPACVSACLGKALDFGVIENIPEGREQAKTGIPGFPRTDITHPNIRFQQTRTTQRDMRRVDDTPVKYHRDDDADTFRPVLDPKRGFKRQWNLKKLLGSHENAHIAFTLSAQAVMGAFVLLTLGAWLGADALAAYNRGKSIYWARRGQLNFNCGSCHVQSAGQHIRANVLSPALGQATGWPVYRSKWGDLGTFHRRFKGCMKQMRAKPYKPQSEEFRDLEYFLTYMSNGIEFNGPSARK